MKYLIIKEEDLLLLRNADFQTIKQVMFLFKSIDTDKFEEMATEAHTVHTPSKDVLQLENGDRIYTQLLFEQNLRKESYKQALNDIIK